MGAARVVRCGECKAYINPFVRFVESGRYFICCLCGRKNAVPSAYFSPVDVNGRRKDLQERAELTHGCVEFVAPSEYMVRPPMPPVFFFVIDVSFYSVASGMLTTVVSTIKTLVDSLPNPRTKVGLCTFDGSVQFYDLRAGLSKPRMMVVADIDKMFLPLSVNNLLVNLRESKDLFLSVLEKIPALFKDTRTVDSALGGALLAANAVMKRLGGKVIVFQSTLPNKGESFSLVNREQLNTEIIGTDKEITLLKPNPDKSDAYKNIALDCSKQQITIDLHLFSAQHTDAATLKCLTQITGGSLFCYQPEKLGNPLELNQLAGDLVLNLTRETGWEAVMRLRTSKGLAVHPSGIYGHFFIRSVDLLSLPSCDADKAFAFEIELDDKLNTATGAFLQCALLYTNSSGERRIRVQTIQLPVVSTLADVFRSINQKALCTLMLKKVVDQVLQNNMSQGRKALTDKCIEILKTYRSAFSSASGSQLTLPASLSFLPLYTLGLIKNKIFQNKVRVDERSGLLTFATTSGVERLMDSIHPQLYALHNMDDTVGIVHEESGKVTLPPILDLSSEKLSRDGIFLLQNGLQLYLWLGEEVDPSRFSSLFDKPLTETTDLPELENDFSIRVRAIINQIRAEKPYLTRLEIITPKSPSSVSFYSQLIQDRVGPHPSYYEFFMQLQSLVNK